MGKSWAFLLVNLCAASAVSFDGGIYSGLQVNIREDLGTEGCREVLENLQSVLNASSWKLHNLTGGRAWFRDVTIVLPARWRERACQPGRKIVTKQTVVSKPDLVVTRNHPTFGDQPWTLQAKICRGGGERVNVPSSFLDFNSSDLSDRSAKFVKEWAKYRYGVFEESGFLDDPLYPPVYMEGNLTVVNGGCVGKTEVFCPLQSPYNRIAPTKQNILCGGRSAWETIFDGDDLREVEGVDDSGNRQVYTLAPQESIRPTPGGDSIRDTTFRYVEPAETKFVLVLDISSHMEHANRWTNVKKALFRFIQLLDEGATLSIVIFGETASLVLPPTIVTEEKREGLHGRIPRRVMETNQSCVQCGLKLAADTVRKSGGNVVLISGTGTDVRISTSLVDEIRASSIQLFTVSYNLDKQPDMPQLINYSTFYAVHPADANPLSSLMESLLDILNHGNANKNPVQKLYESHHSTHEFVDNFYIEEDLRTDIMVTLAIDDEQKIEFFEVSDPSGRKNIFSKFEDGLVIFKFTGHSEPGIWSYRTKLYSDAQLPAEKMTVDVLAKGSQNSVTVAAFSNFMKDQTAAPIIFAKVEKGHQAVLNANVTARVAGADVSIEIRLQDGGTGYPDVTRGDGIYSAYVPAFSELGGALTVKVTATDDDTSFTSRIETTQHSQKCCGSLIKYENNEPTGKFRRYTAGPTIFSRVISVGGADVSPPSRISDLKIIETNSSSLEVLLSWSAPGGDYDHGQASRYQIRCHTDPLYLNETNFEDKSILVHPPQPLPTLPYGEAQNSFAGVPWTNEVFYYAVVAFDESGNRGAVSNLVAAYIQEQITTTTTTTIVPSSAFNLQDKGLMSENNPLHRDKSKMYLIAGIVGGIVLVLSIVAIYIVIRAKRKSDEKSVEVVDSYEAGYYPDLKMKKDISGSSDGIYNWLETLPRSDSGATDNSFHQYMSKDTTPVLKDQSLESLGSVPYEISSRPSTSTDDSASVDDNNQISPDMAFEGTSPSKLDYTAADLDFGLNMRNNPEEPPIYDNDIVLEDGTTPKDNYANEILNRCKQYYSFRDPTGFGPSLDRTANKDHFFDSLPNDQFRNPDHFQPRGSNCYNFQFMTGLSGEQQQLRRKRHESVV